MADLGMPYASYYDYRVYLLLNYKYINTYEYFK